MLRIDNLKYRIGDRVLFDGASAVVNAGHRVGFVGRNGTGKTTLLRLITGALEPEKGTVSVSGRWRIGMTSQEAPSGSRNPVEAVTDRAPPLDVAHEQVGGGGFGRASARGRDRGALRSSG